MDNEFTHKKLPLGITPRDLIIELLRLPSEVLDKRLMVLQDGSQEQFTSLFLDSTFCTDSKDGVVFADVAILEISFTG